MTAESACLPPIILAFHLVLLPHRSPGYALTLLAESTTNAIHCSESVSVPGGTPEDVALQAARALLTEISRAGCIDRKHQCMVLLLMVLGSEDVGRVRMGELSVRS
jgi:RNA 3'-terminal phosphate cyclase-like protein